MQSGPRWHQSGEDYGFLPSQAVHWISEVQQPKGISIAHLPLLKLMAAAGQKLLQVALSLVFTSACSDLCSARHALNASANALQLLDSLRMALTCLFSHART